MVPSLLTRQQVGLGLMLGPETEAELWYFGNMFVTESNDGYVVVDVWWMLRCNKSFGHEVMKPDELNCVIFLLYGRNIIEY